MLLAEVVDENHFMCDCVTRESASKYALASSENVASFVVCETSEVVGAICRHFKGSKASKRFYILGLRENKNYAKETMKMQRASSSYSAVPSPRCHFVKLSFTTNLFNDVFTTAYGECE